MHKPVVGSKNLCSSYGRLILIKQAGKNIPHASRAVEINGSIHYNRK
jgi:hypothetical protein